MITQGYFEVDGYRFVRLKNDCAWPNWAVFRGDDYIGIVAQPDMFRGTECIAIASGGEITYDEFPGVPAIFVSPQRAARSIEENNAIARLTP